MRVLVIEDQASLRRNVVRHLREAGFSVDETGDGHEGLWFATENEYAVIVLDLTLPGVDGLEILRRLREARKGAAVLVTTARDAVGDRITGLDAGADDYLVKPFALDEMLARVRALARRTFGVRDPVLRLGGLEIDTVARIASAGGSPLGLTAMEYALLELLALRAGQVVRRSDLWEHLYDFGESTDSNVLEVIVARLRKKLAAGGLPPLIRTRRGEGYLLDPDASASA